MGVKIKKNEIDLNTTLVEINFILKGKGRDITVHTTATEACEFVDYMMKNRGNTIHRKSEKEKFDNKFFVFDDYKNKETICIERDSIRSFSVPFYIENKDEIEFRILRLK